MTDDRWSPLQSIKITPNNKARTVIKPSPQGKALCNIAFYPRTVGDAGPYNHNIKSATKSVGATTGRPRKTQ